MVYKVFRVWSFDVVCLWMFWLQESRWNYLFSFLALPAMLQLCVLPFLPESPRYLLMERRDEAGAEKGIAEGIQAAALGFNVSNTSVLVML